MLCVVVACHSKTVAASLKHRLISELELEDSDIVFYHGKSDQRTKAVDFGDAAAAWRGKLVIIYTGTVSVGVSANSPEIQDLFGIFSDGNASACQTVQMVPSRA